LNKRLITKKLKIIIKDSSFLLLILFLWFLGGFLVCLFVLKLDYTQALKATLLFKEVDSDFSPAYNTWSNGIIFGIIFTLFFQNVIGRYNPERGCRMVASEIRDHIIVVGYSHLGERLVGYLRKKKLPYCLIEKDKERVDELLRAGEPVVIDNAKEPDALNDANAASARVVVITSNNLETSLVVTKRARELNKNCKIITRCFQDEFTEIIESLGADEIISSSKNAFDDIVKKTGI